LILVLYPTEIFKVQWLYPSGTVKLRNTKKTAFLLTHNQIITEPGTAFRPWKLKPFRESTMRRKQHRTKSIPIPAGSSSGANHTANNNNQPISQTLQQLRREAAAPPTPEAVEKVTRMVTERSTPPEIGRILSVPDTPAIAPRSRSGLLRSRHAPPGPATPASWSMYNPAGVASTTPERDVHFIPSRQLMKSLSKLANTPSGSETLPKMNSLLHLSLKTMALNWEFIRYYEQENLMTLPRGIRSQSLVLPLCLWTHRWNWPRFLESAV